MSAERVIAVARGELGKTENPPGSNRIKYWDEYDKAWQGQPWCVTFLWWCFRHTGEASAFMGGGKTASCGILQKWYKAHGQTVPVSEVQEGDIVLLNFHCGPLPEHCGLVVDVTPNSPSKEPYAVTTVEGNTSPGLEGSQDNGGCVARKRRYPSQIVEVCRPEYKEEKEQVDDIKGHWAEKDIRWCMEHGIMQGYPDGCFGPNKPITRAELAAVAHRLCDWSLQLAAEVEAREKKEEL